MPFIGADQSVTTVVASPPSTLSDTQVFGSGAEEDVKIIFDGNTVDYHIGMDDSGDTLNFGKGTALGTTTSQTFDTNGIITFDTIQDLKNMMDMRNSYFNIGEYISRGDSIKNNFEVAKKYSSMGEVLWIHGIKELVGG